MTKAYATIDNNYFLAFPRNSGVSEDAHWFKKRMEELQENSAHSLTVSQHYNEARHALTDAIEKCSVDNWDGYGAKRISGASCGNAMRFAQVLPASVPVPELYVDPEGEITFEWYVAPRQVFSVTIGSNNEMVYAGLFGSNDTHGTEYLGDELPDTLLDNIRRVFPKGGCLAAAKYSHP